ncbi:MAG: hypothetical protein ABR556_00330 [Pyrinomonadaceae bacterium]
MSILSDDGIARGGFAQKRVPASPLWRTPDNSPAIYRWVKVCVSNALEAIIQARFLAYSKLLPDEWL